MLRDKPLFVTPGTDAGNADHNGASGETTPVKAGGPSR
jgi:hypothetical protein